MLMGHTPRSRLDLLQPDLSAKVKDKQAKQEFRDNNKKPRAFVVSDLVYGEDFTNSPVKWLPGKVVAVTDPLSYRVELTFGTTVRCHIDNVRLRETVAEEPEVGQDEGTEFLGPSSTS